MVYSIFRSIPDKDIKYSMEYSHIVILSPCLQVFHGRSPNLFPFMYMHITNRKKTHPKHIFSWWFFPCIFNISPKDCSIYIYNNNMYKILPIHLRKTDEIAIWSGDASVDQDLLRSQLPRPAESGSVPGCSAWDLPIKNAPLRWTKNEANRKQEINPHGSRWIKIDK